MTLPDQKAFTLIELLVVLVIIAILAALGFGAYSQVRMNARAAECASNLRQVGTALHLYLNDHKGHFPGSTHTEDWEGSWFNTLDPYIGNSREVRISPADPHADERRELGSSSYLLNDYLAYPAYDGFGRRIDDYTTIARIPNPVETMAVFPVSETADLTTDHPHSRRWTGDWNAVLADIQPDLHRTGEPAEDHSRGKAAYLYVDGHVDFIEAREFRDRIESGENPAKPPQ